MVPDLPLPQATRPSSSYVACDAPIPGHAPPAQVAGWRLARARRSLVKAIIAMSCSSPSALALGMALLSRPFPPDGKQVTDDAALIARACLPAIRIHAAEVNDVS